MAATTRKALEAETGEPVVTSMNASDFADLLTGTLFEIANRADENQDPNGSKSNRTHKSEEELYDFDEGVDR